MEDVYDPSKQNPLYVRALHTNAGVRLSIYGVGIISVYGFITMARFDDWRWWIGFAGVTLLAVLLFYHLFDLAVCLRFGLQQWRAKRS